MYLLCSFVQIIFICEMIFGTNDVALLMYNCRCLSEVTLFDISLCDVPRTVLVISESPPLLRMKNKKMAAYLLALLRMASKDDSLMQPLPRHTFFLSTPSTYRAVALQFPWHAIVVS